MIGPALCVAVLALSANADASPLPARIEVHPILVDGPAPRTEVGRTYASARRALRSGRVKEALNILAVGGSTLLEDRESLLRGDALHRLGEWRLAEAAYRDALGRAQLRPVGREAVRGLIKCFEATGRDASWLAAIELLLKERKLPDRAQLKLARARALLSLGRQQDAVQAAFEVTQLFPGKRTARQAKQLIERQVKRGATRPASAAKAELSRIRRLWQSGKYKRAEAALKKLRRRKPKHRNAVDLETAALYGKSGKTKKAHKLLRKLLKAKLTDDQRLETLERLGRLEIRRDRNDKAIGYFKQLAREFPKADQVPELQYIAAWLHYNSGSYPKAAKALLDFTEAYPKWKRRPEALWFSSWSAHLGGNDKLAIETLEQLLRQHRSSDLRLWANYFTGRFLQDAGKWEKARTAYQKVLSIAPLSYFGHLATERLGVSTSAIDPPPVATIEMSAALKALGRKRPVNVDRAIVLSRLGLDRAAVSELRAANRAFRKVRNMRGRVLVAEMVEQLGGHHEAFALASTLVHQVDLDASQPYAFRAWRLAYPKAFWPEVSAAAKAHGLDPLLVLSIMRTESSFRPHVRSRVGARGLMQIMPQTARRIGRRDKEAKRHAVRYTKPASNIWLGAWYLSRLLKRYHGQLAAAAGAYNAGPGPMDTWLREMPTQPTDAFIESLPYRETRRYIRRVLETYQTYRRLDGLAPISMTQDTMKKSAPKGAVSF